MLEPQKTILIVDDDPNVRKSLRKVLSAAGHKVMEAADGPGADDLFEAEQFDLLLLDINLRGGSGWDVFEHVTSRTPAVPIIIITGKANQHDTAVAAGVGALMEKPLDPARLLKTIQELLAEPKEARLRRLCGFSQDVRYVPTARLQQKLHG